MPDHCQACQAPVLWAANDKTGKKAPVNATLDPAGNVVLLAASGTYHVLTVEARDAMMGTHTLFGDTLTTQEVEQFGHLPRRTLHFVTCPQADHFRRCKVCHHTPCQCPKRS